MNVVLKPETTVSGLSLPAETLKEKAKPNTTVSGLSLPAENLKKTVVTPSAAKEAVTSPTALQQKKAPPPPAPQQKKAPPAITTQLPLTAFGFQAPNSLTSPLVTRAASFKKQNQAVLPMFHVTTGPGSGGIGRGSGTNSVMVLEEVASEVAVVA